MNIVSGCVEIIKSTQDKFKREMSYDKLKWASNVNLNVKTNDSQKDLRFFCSQSKSKYPIDQLLKVILNLEETKINIIFGKLG